MDSMSPPISMRPSISDKYKDNPIVSYFILPCILDGTTNIVTVEHQGPSQLTTHWGVYLRLANGSVEWYTDTDDEATAVQLYEPQLLELYNVKREPTTWLKNRSVEFVSVTATRHDKDGAVIETVTVQRYTKCNNDLDASARRTYPQHVGTPRQVESLTSTKTTKPPRKE